MVVQAQAPFRLRIRIFRYFCRNPITQAEKDLKGASDLLVKMEGAGYTPNSQMLDKVLELYSEQEKGKAEKAEEDVPADASFDMVLKPIPPPIYFFSMEKYAHGFS